ncbi:ATPase domain of HSP90 chaperone/DNA topoisomerase II/histidine kinase, partial [Lepidopterella palustris CBS 459.81]
MEGLAASSAIKMSIQTLPSTTIKQIRSAQVLTDPGSVVKELIDNTLDARATAIFVEISANTLDAIQVRDNGHGIFPGDRAMLGRRHCTSKLREFD